MLTPAEILQGVDTYTLSQEEKGLRKHLGASEIGERCLRKLFYKFRWVKAESFEPRMLRLFQRGHREEAVIADELRGAGWNVEVPTKGAEEDYFRFKDCEEHFAGTCDGVGIEPGGDEWVLLEMKTWKEETKDRPAPAFQALKRQGLQATEPKHWHQMQVYQGQLKLQRGLYIAKCKNNDETYYQWVSFDRQHFEENLAKAEAVISAETPPERISNNPKSYSCSYCIFNTICHERQPIRQEHQHCRNCIHGHPAAAGTWECAKGREFGKLCESYQANT